MKLKFQSPTGMRDILDEDFKYYQKIQDVVSDIVSFYKFKRIETPILEPADLFLKGVGTNTDIVQKEMFSVKTKKGDTLALRPEGTAPIIRAYLEKGMQSLPKPVKLWYFGPYFRHERPQAGRFRQFWQFGLEAIGEDSPAIDAEIVLITYTILKTLKLKDITIEVNSIGDSCCRPYYKKLLSNYLRSRAVSLCANCRKRLKENPLRVLDCKEEKCQRVISQSPQIIDHLCKNCRRHFKQFLEFLDELELPYHLNPYLVRGLDYYTKTVFEVFTQQLSEETAELTKNALAGGGRYDNLVKLFGGKETPATGVAAGVERIIEVMKKGPVQFKKKLEPQVFLIQLGDLAKRKSLKLMEKFRKAKIPIGESLGRDSLRAQLKIADKIGVKCALIFGQKEALEGKIIVRDMRSGKQEEVRLDKLIKEIKKRLK